MQEIYQEIAERYGVNVSAVKELERALSLGNGRMAQFNIPELGGMGQWMANGMTMVGDMNNHSLKAKVDGICHDLLAAMIDAPTRQSQASSSTGMGAFVWDNLAAIKKWWPESLGTPNSTGRQNEMEYAYFGSKNRLAINLGGKITLYDTTGYDINGVSQQQSNGVMIVVFSSQGKVVPVNSLDVVSNNS